MNGIREVESKWQGRFFGIWMGQAFSILGSGIVQFALVWWLTRTTGSATVLAVATLVAVLPAAILGPLAGTLVDRWNRRLVMILADGFVALASVGLAVSFLTGSVQIWHVYLVMVARSLGEAFHWPAMLASTTLMVPQKHLSRIAGLNQAIQGSLNVVSPPIGALLLSVLPMPGVMAVDVATAALAITPLLLVSIPQPARSPDQEGASGSSVWHEFMEGLRYVGRLPGVIALLVIFSLANFLLVPSTSLLPLLVTDHFGGGAVQLGWMESVWGIGLVLGGLGLGMWGGFRRKVATTLMGLVLAGAACLWVGLVPASGFTLAVVGMGLLGLSNPLINGPVTAAMQALIPPDMQGRVFTVLRSLATIAMPLGLAVAGPVADAVGGRAWWVVGGAGCVVMGLVSFALPVVMTMEDGALRARDSATATGGTPSTEA